MIQGICKYAVVITALMLATQFARAQDPGRFVEEINAFQLEDATAVFDNTIVFTGSSSVRLWPGINEEFPGVKVLNRGFGGSMMSDLLYYIRPLVIKYKPEKVFIYEGDNDLGNGRTPREIITDAKEIVRLIKQGSPATAIYFIAAKPSILRWDLKEAYLQLNYQLGLWSMIQPDITFIDVWTPMCDSMGEVLQDIFIDDGLHMNSKGYAIWKEVISPYIYD